ncbi:MAG: hypothetical protein ACE5R4_01210 [Armatimonadota bacterium]
MLDKEKRLFAEHQKEWAETHAGKFVLLKDDRVIGFYDSEEVALTEAARLLGLTSFLVRSVSQPEEPIRIPAMAIGALHADPSLAVPGRG